MGYWDEYQKTEAKLNDSYLARREAEEKANYAAAVNMAGRSRATLDKETLDRTRDDTFIKIMEARAGWLEATK